MLKRMRFLKDYIDIICNDSTYTYKKDSVYGYRSKDGIDYRIIEGKYYPILNSGETILIYKWQESVGMKGQAPTFSYYFNGIIFQICMRSIWKSLKPCLQTTKHI